MTFSLTHEELINEIAKRAPWYQRIAFPKYGITTTDRPEWVQVDAAVDNIFTNDVDSKTASTLRPWPKWERFASLLPEVKGRSVLEVGSSCGFFVFEFCRLGAKYATGIEFYLPNVEKARFCAKVLELENAHFVHGDVCSYREVHDVVFLTSVLEHLVYPFYYLVRVLCLAKEALVVDTYHNIEDDAKRICRLNMEFTEDVMVGNQVYTANFSFYLSRRMLLDYLALVGVPPGDIEQKVFFDDGVNRRFLTIVNTKRFQEGRRNNPWFQHFKDFT
jgi:hypothetical protein